MENSTDELAQVSRNNIKNEPSSRQSILWYFESSIPILDIDSVWPNSNTVVFDVVYIWSPFVARRILRRQINDADRSETGFLFGKTGLKKIKLTVN